MEELDLEKRRKKKSFTFLMVLCIITFGLSAMAFAGGLGALAMQDHSLQSLQQLQNQMQNTPYGSGVDYSQYIAAYQKWGLWVNILSVLSGLISAGGALLMWKLKKSGYFIYIVGQILPFIGLYGLMGGAMPKINIFPGMEIIMHVSGFIIPVAMFVMYSFNLKHMK